MKNPGKVIAVLLFLGLHGCQVYTGRVPELPGPLPEHFAGAEAAQEISEPGRFWEQFNDSTLNELEKQGLDNNLTIKQAMARHAQFTALEKISRASALPFLNLNASSNHDKSLSMGGSSEGSGLKLSTAAAYEIDLWNKLGSERNAAFYNTQASVAEIKTAFISVAAQVADLYYLGAEQQAQQELNARIIASQSDTLSRIERRYEAGLVPALDVYQARQNLIAAKAKSPVFQANQAKAHHALTILLGRFPAPDTDKGLAQLPETLPEVPALLPSALLCRRPDIEAALLKIKARDNEVAAAVAARFPSFNLSAAFGSASLDYARTISGTFWNLVLDATMPLFDSGRRQAEVERRQALLEEEVARYQQTVLKAFQEVEDALAADHSVQEQIRLLRERYTLTTTTLRLAEEQYFEGLTDYLSVLTAQTNHFEVQTQLLSARRQLISERLSLMKALGGDWMLEEMNNRTQENGEKR